MTQFDVYMQTQATVFGTTQDIALPYSANPVEAADAESAITIVADVMLDAVGNEAACTTYGATPHDVATMLTVTEFRHQAVFGEPPPPPGSPGEA